MRTIVNGRFVRIAAIQRPHMNSKIIQEKRAMGLAKQEFERDEALFKDDPNFKGWHGECQGFTGK